MGIDDITNSPLNKKTDVFCVIFNNSGVKTNSVFVGTVFLRGKTLSQSLHLLS